MGLFGGVKSFLVEKFWLPIVDESVYYNPFNTALYSMLFAVAAAYIGFPALKKLDVDLDRQFFTGIAPFVFLAGALRSLKDIEAVNTILLETPFIYLLMFGVVVASIFAAKKLAPRMGRDENKLLLGIGSILLLLILPFYSISNLTGLAMILGVTITWVAALYTVLKIFVPRLLTPEFYIPVATHYMDASVTSVALLFPGTAEKHVLAQFFIDLLGPIIGMFLMKTLVIVPAVYYIRREAEGEKKLYYLFLIAVLLGIYPVRSDITRRLN